MFCNQCGQANSNDAKFCSSCGNKLEIKNIQPAQTHQQPIKTESPQPRIKQIELWNPNAAANWSLLFTPIFGSFLQMKNWQALGNSNEANNARNWLIFSIAFILFINLGAPFIWSDPVKLDTYPRSMGLVYIIIWYFAFARIQPKYVKEKLNDIYQKKSWSAPLLIGFSVFVFCVFLIMVIPENKSNRPQQTNDIPLDNSQQKPGEMDFNHAQQALQCESKRYKASKYGLDFYGFTEYSIKNKNPIISQLNWGVTNYNPGLNPSSTSGSIRVELRAFPKSIENSLESYLIATYYPNFSNTDNILNVGAYAANITSTAQSSGIPSGSYCIVALLQEYSPDCIADENYCGVAWIQFKGMENF